MIDSDMAAFVVFLIQDFFKVMEMPLSLRAFTDELDERVKMSLSAALWYRMSSITGLTSLLQSFSDQNTKISYLHVLIDFAVAERRKIVHASAPTLVQMTKKTLRPKSAKVCSSTPALPVANNQDEHGMTKMDIRTCVSYPKLTRKSNGIIKEKDELGCLVQNGQSKEKHRRFSTLSMLSLPQIVTLHDENLPNEEPSSKPDDDKSHERWIPEGKRVNRLRRQLLDVRHNKLHQQSYEKVMQHINKPPYQCPDELQPTECKLCLVTFPKCNLVLDIPYKIIMDLRKEWDPSLKELNPSIARPPMYYDAVKVCRFCAQFVHNAHDRETATIESTMHAKKITPKGITQSRRPSTTHIKTDTCTDPYALEPYLSDSSSGDEHYIIGNDPDDDTRLIQGEIGKQLLYGAQHERTLRNLNQNEWNVITGGSNLHIFKHNSLVDGANALAPTLRTLLSDH
ncbi:hypothetical protein THRCLA_02980 [Thraustotheca clavata]|uniref:Uncharacterized protein n=1 Tax=Thraustotheca clavata TaxID=74557 RepID=A0A1W0A3K4_9STRA|nr:hypothetical protein THRCLA_02980 [Thraustotheca clavata]